jgi:hypothetical protein
MIYSLPEGLWILSFMCLMMVIWSSEVRRQNILWIYIIPVLLILTEFCQLMQITRGTFDLNDLYLYLTRFILPIILFNPPKALKKNLKQHLLSFFAVALFILFAYGSGEGGSEPIPKLSENNSNLSCNELKNKAIQMVKNKLPKIIETMKKKDELDMNNEVDIKLAFNG